MEVVLVIFSVGKIGLIEPCKFILSCMKSQFVFRRTDSFVFLGLFIFSLEELSEKCGKYRSELSEDFEIVLLFCGYRLEGNYAYITFC